MTGILEGIRIIEVAQYVFVPVCTGVLAEWGADVIKVEHPTRGDAYRGLRGTGSLAITGPVNYAIEHANRGKRSIGIDLSRADGREVLDSLLAGADVLATNLLPASRDRLGLDLETLQRAHPHLVIARGTALGERGPEKDRGGFDHAVYWARSGAQYGATPDGAERPAPMPSGAFGDSTAGLAMAGGIAAALLARERTGRAPVVDLSLLGFGIWSMASATSGSMLTGENAKPLPRVPVTNPLAGTYRTADGRWIALGCLKGFYEWPQLCHALGQPDWIDDPRFSTGPLFAEHTEECAAMLDALFASAPLSIWREKLSDLDAVWGIVQTNLEAARDPQIAANGHIAQLNTANDDPFELVASPIQFNENPPQPRPAPQAGQHTEEILRDLGINWAGITDLKKSGAIN